MALPNSITYDNDQLATSFWKQTNDNFVNLLTKEGETFLPKLAASGRIFAVPDSEIGSDTFFYADPGDTSIVGVEPSTYGTGATLGVTSAEFQSEFFWNFREWQNNVIWPTTEVAHPMNMGKRVRAKRAVLFNREEAVFVRGATTLTGSYAINAPYSGDTDYDTSATKHPMSLLSLFASGCVKGGSGGTTSGDKSAEKFMNLKQDDTDEWAPTVRTASAANGSGLLRDITYGLQAATFGDRSPNYGMTALDVWEYIAHINRGYAALPQPMGSDLVKGPRATIMVGGVELGWSRFLADKSTVWDLTSAATSCYPLLFLDLGSLRLDVPAGGGEMGGGGLSYVRKISGVQVMEQQTQSFYRIAAKRALRIENGRRSFLAVDGVTL